MKINLFFIGFLSILMAFVSTSFAAYDDSGTAYSQQTTDTWIQDRAGEGIKMVNSFVCIVKNSNGGTRPNTSWKALIDEIKCELQSPDENATAGSVAYAEATIVSTRASNTSDQELKTYFNSADGSKYIASMSLNNSTDSIFDIVMDFRWYASQGDSTQGTHTNTMNGWSEISVGDNNSDGNLDTAVRHTEHMPAAFGGPFDMGTAAVTYGPDNKVTKFVTSLNDQDLGFPVVYQGVTDETKYRRRTLQASNNAVLDTSCFDRSKQWANTYDYNLYDNVTGAEVTISGSFGFTYSSGTKRGYMGHWGVHLDGGNADYPSGSTTVAMVQEDTDVNMTLYAAPGKLTKLTQEDVTLNDGEKFRIWDGSGETEVYYRAAGCGSSGFTTKSDGTCTEYNFDNQYWKVRNGGNNYIEPGDRMWSEMNRAEVILKTLPNAVMFKRDRVTPSSTSPNVSSDLSLTCVGDCPKGKPLKSEYETNQHREFCMTPFNQDWIDGHGNPGDSSGCTYTFKSSGDADAPLTLFRGSDPIILYNDGTTPMNTSHKSEGRHYYIGSGRYILTSDIGGTCAADDNPSATNNIWNCAGGVFEWGTGLERWDQYYYAKYDNNSYVNIESPVKLKYTFATADDQNTAFTNVSPFLYVWKKENVDASGYRNNTFTNTDATAYPAQYDGKTFLLQYEGAGNLQGLPNRNTDNDWLKLINPKSGTQVIDADNSSKGYVLKAVGTGMMLAKHGTATACDAMTFEFDATNIPSVTEKTLPQFTFDSKPTIATVSVQHGVEQ